MNLGVYMFSVNVKQDQYNFLGNTKYSEIKIT